MPPTPGFSFSDRKTYITYVLMLLFGVAAVALIVWLGSGPQMNTDGHGSIHGNLWQNFRSPLSILLIQIVVIRGRGSR